MKSNINIEVALGDDRMPEAIEWTAPGGGMEEPQAAKGMLLGFWDGSQKSALRIDLWTRKLMVDEMNDFFFQSLAGMADTYERATRNQELAAELREFARSFHQKAIQKLMEEEQQEGHA